MKNLERRIKATRLQLAAIGVALGAIVPSIGIAQVAFYGVGDLPGGITQSEVRDTTRVGSVLYAVGGSSANPGSTGDDTAFLWTSTGGMTALPPLTAGVIDVNVILASAITPDAAYIASRAHFNPAATGQRHAVRVTTAGLPNPSANLDLGTLTGFPQQSVATSISNDGSVLYGFARYNAAAQLQAVRYTAAGPTVTAIPFLNAGDDTSQPTHRGTSSDGSIMVGFSSNSVTSGGNLFAPGNAAFRYVQGAGVSAIPFLAGGTWNIPVALSPDGNLVLVVGDSPTAPNGEVYLYNAATLAQTSFGTPAAGWTPNNLAGMYLDGSLVAIAFGDRAPAGASFIHNASGWHDLQTIVAGAGVDLTGWTLDFVEGMSADGTRIWGGGTHNGNAEGFIVEFPARYLATYAASPPAQSIVGSYTNSDTTAEGAFVLVFLANGTYFEIQDAPAADAPTGVDGFERGTYTWDAATHALTLTTLVDTNGDEGTCPGLCGVPGITATKLGNIATLMVPGGAFSAPLVTGSSPIVGTWVIGDTTVADSSAIVTFFANGTYLEAYDGAADVNHPKGMERGTYTWDQVTGAFTATALVDTDGTAGLSNPTGSVTVTISGDTLTYTNLGGPGTAYRVIAPPLPPSLAVPMSRRAHGLAGSFDNVLDGAPTNPTTEPRQGPTQTVVLTFDKPITGATATVTEGVATAGTPTISGNSVSVDLAGVTDVQYVTVLLTNVASADGGTGGSGSVRVGFLAGDVNRSRSVSVSDLVLVNRQQLVPLTTFNCVMDVNVSGSITVSDKVIVNRNQLHTLPLP